MSDNWLLAVLIVTVGSCNVLVHDDPADRTPAEACCRSIGGQTGGGLCYVDGERVEKCEGGDD